MSCVVGPSRSQRPFAVTRAGVALLLINVVLVAWLFALLSDRLWKRSRMVDLSERTQP